MAASLPLHPRRHDLRRVGRDPAQHHRRAHARSAPRGTAMSTAPPYVPGHALLAGKNVVVTASAGAGIGMAAAKRCLEEGARVVISDTHERRLGETLETLRTDHGAGNVHALACNVTDEHQVQALIAFAVEALGSLDVMINNAGLGGTKSIVDMADDEW